MSNKHGARALILLLASLSAGGAFAQTPAGLPQQDLATTDDSQLLASVAAGHLLCDTAHDGGAAELDVAFGQPGDRALLGDVDGDGHDDPCVFRAGELQCDTAHNGGAAETVIAFSGPAANPLLGDVDGDGRDDLCLFAAGTFACDTGHDGGAAEKTFAISGPGRPLIGNVDGV